MPGLVGIASTGEPEETAKRFGVARDRTARHGGGSAATISVNQGRCLLGQIELGAGPAPAARLATAPEVLFHGVLYNDAVLRGELSIPPPGRSTEALLLALYAQFGTEFVSRLEGEFCLALVDPDASRLVVATDAIGNYPVYWHHSADGLVFASSLSAVLAAVPGARRLDLRAVADYLTVGAVFEDKTLAANVSLIGPATVLTYNLRANRCSQRAYLELQTLFERRPSSKAAYFDALTESFRRAVARAAAGVRPVGLSLSGGLDSRAMLAVVDRSISLKSYTLGIEGCADQVIADQLSRLARTEHHYFRLTDAYLRDFLPNLAQMVSFTDGMYLSHGLTEMLAIGLLQATGIEVLLRGHGGELAKAHLAWPLHTDSNVYAMQSLDELVPYLAKRANYITADLPLVQILTPAAAATAGAGSLDSFAAVLRGQDLSPPLACSYLYLREFTRRFTVPSLEIYRTIVDVRMPYLDPAYLRVLLSAPPEWRDTTEIHQRLTAAGLPQLLKVRNSNTGAPADAGRRQEFVLDKLNTLLKRLNVRGYRHYHNFDSWMRRMLIETVETELLSPDARVLTFLDRPAVARLIADTRAGTADRSHLLQILLILELWLRENAVDAAA